MKPEPVFPANGATVKSFQVAPTRVRGMTVRAFPDAAQAQRLSQLIGQGRYVYNVMRGLQNTPAPEGNTWLNKAGWSALNKAMTDLLAQAREDARQVLLHPSDPSKWGTHHWLVDCPRTLVTQKYNDLKQAWSHHASNPGHFAAPTFKKKSSRDGVRFQIDPRQYDREIHLHERQWQAAKHALKFPRAVFFEESEDVVRMTHAWPLPEDPAHVWIKIPKVGRVRVELTEPVHGEVV